MFVLIDDLGWNDVGWHGSELETPRLDELSARGTRLEAHYAQPSCTPSRAALLTGRYPLRYGLQGGTLRADDRVGLPPEERTLAKVLRESGYRTHIVGKWHLGNRSPYLPDEHGFDHHYGCLLSAVRAWKHTNNETLDWWRDGIPVEEKGHATDLLRDEAVRVLREHAAHDGVGAPLFLYLPFTAVHAPLEARAKEIAAFAHLDTPERRVFAAMVRRMDAAVGAVVDAIEELGRSERTLIVVCSDNGGADYVASSNLPLRGGKLDVYEGGVRTVAFCLWPGRIPAGASTNEPIHLVDWFPTIAARVGVDLEPDLLETLDGRDVWGTITGGEPSPHEEVVLNSSIYGSALRAGRYKVVQPAEGAPLELYDLEQDPSETRDLAASEPARLAELATSLAVWRTLRHPELVLRPEQEGDDESLDPGGR